MFASISIINYNFIIFFIIIFIIWNRPQKSVRCF